MMGMKQGPNVRKLIVHKMSLLMIPPGSKEPFATALDALTKPGNIGDTARDATAWVEQAIAVVKTAPDNPYGDDDEAIAGAILEGIEAKKREKRVPGPASLPLPKCGRCRHPYDFHQTHGGRCVAGGCECLSYLFPEVA
jgi:hypothetical protein